MATEETREALREARKAGGASFVVPKHKAKAEPSPLEDVETQAEILEPKPLEATIGGEPVEIHELAAKHARALVALTHTCVIELFSDHKGDGSTFSARLAALIVERYSDRMLPFIARSTAAAGELSDADVQKLVADIDDKIRYDEIVKVLISLFNANKTIDAILPRNGAAKKVASAPTKTGSVA